MIRALLSLNISDKINAASSHRQPQVKPRCLTPKTTKVCRSLDSLFEASHRGVEVWLTVFHSSRLAI